MTKQLIKLGFAYGLLTAVLLALCAYCSGCATPPENEDWFHDWVRAGASYQEYRLPACEVCASTKEVEACHIYPQVDYPDMKNTKENIVTLCRPCHEVLSHFRNTSRYWNPNLREIVEVMKNSKRTYRKYDK